MNAHRHNSKILQETREKIELTIRQGKTPIAVFDLDSTLFDVTPRLQKILHDFANNPRFLQQFPENCKLLQEAEAHPKDWGIRNAMVRAGVDGQHPEFESCIKDFWHACFFSNSYLQYDVPYAGAVDFVCALAKLGCRIVYLTGRDVPRMQLGTVQTLQQWKFPLQSPQCELVLKPMASMDDAQFKSDYFLQFSQEQMANVWLFENEPVNVNLVRKNHPQVQMIFIDSVHAGKEEIPTDIPQIIHYLFDH